MRRSCVLTLSCLAVFALSGCDRGADEAARGDDNGPAPATPAAPAGDSASMRYRCDDGYDVAILGDTARVTTQDGRQIDLQRVAERSPPLFAGEALQFAIESDGAVLGQDEGGRFDCRESQ